MTPNLLPSIEYLNEAIKYCEDSPSKLRWRERPRSHFKTERGYKISLTRDSGEIAGSKTRSGDGIEFWVIKINQIVYPVHRIIWAIFNGRDPKEFEVDHQDGNPLNNKHTNLRIANRQENACNRGCNKNSTSKYKGVCFEKRTQKWYAQISFGGKNNYLGRFKNEEDAKNAYDVASIKIHGEFARPSTGENNQNLEKTLAPQSELADIPKF
jgi:hypothetical protein